MSVVRETAYDPVFDSQRHYRSILDCMARPGKIQALDRVALNPPPGLNAASVLVALALIDGEVSFHCVHEEHGESAYLAANTRSAQAALDRADFVFAHGSDAPEFLESINCGTLDYPDTSATLILQLQAASHEPLPGALRFKLEGPGVDGAAVLFVRGLHPDLLSAILARNAEFPLGIDTILTFTSDAGGPCVAGLPRATRISWETV